MNCGRQSHGGIKGGRPKPQIDENWEVDVVYISQYQPRPKRPSHRNRSRAYKEGKPKTKPFLFEKEDWPELSEEPDHHTYHPQPVLPLRERLKVEQEPATKCTMNTEGIMDGWGPPIEDQTSLKEEDSKASKATTFDINEFFEDDPELREMELAVVMAIDEMRKQKMLSDEDQNRLMYALPDLCTYQPPMSVGSFFYPGIPLFSLLAEIFEEWMYSGACFAKDLINYEHLDEGHGLERRKMTLDNVTCHMMGIRGSWEGLEEDEKKHKIKQMLKDIGKRGLLDLLGVRRTVGTQEVFPPTRDILETSFRELNKASSQLTVGARALEKHCHRDKSNNWWGRPKGDEKSKNENAERVLSKILNEVGWLNIHQLPHALPILEVRNTDGYGARWSPDGKEFRGFLEPPMIAGWETGYKH